MSETTNKPLVSVFVIAYKHEKYIGRCLDSILTQVVDFDYEIVLGEDHSPDGTRAICEQYAAKYPQVRLLPDEGRNLGPIGNGIRTFKACTGKYIAMCEGDDYWCDIYKLKKQVSFLEANPDYTISFSSVKIEDEMGWNQPYEYFFPIPDKDVFTIDDFIMSGQNIIPTPTLVFRNVLPDPYPDFFVNAIMGDIPVQLFASDKGKAKMWPEPLAIYRNHGGGMTKKDQPNDKHSDEVYKIFEAFNKFSEYRHDKAFRKRLYLEARASMVYGSMKLTGKAKWRNYKKWFPRYIQYKEHLSMKEVVYYHILLFAPWLLRFAGKRPE